MTVKFVRRSLTLGALVGANMDILKLKSLQDTLDLHCPRNNTLAILSSNDLETANTGLDFGATQWAITSCTDRDDKKGHGRTI